MSREEYMSSLKSALADFEEELAQEIITDYEERFRIGMEKGRTEEEIIRELGSIEDLVRELGDMQEESHTNHSASGQGGTHENTEKSDNSGYTYTEKNFSESFNSLMRGIGRVVDAAMKEAGKAIENAMEQVEIHMESAKRNRYNEEFGKNYEGSEKEGAAEPNVEQSFQGEADCREVIVEAGIADVVVRQAMDGVPKAVCHYYSHKTAMMYPFYAYQEGAIFYVGVRKAEKDSEYRSGYFQINVAPSIELELWVPAGMDVFEVNSSSGDMDVTEVETKAMKLRTKSGDLSVSRCTVGNCYGESMSGDVQVEKSKTDKINLSSKSGDCTLYGIESSYAAAHTASGDVDVRGLVTGKAEFNAMSGAVDLDDVQAEHLKLSTASGDVDARDCRGNSLEASTASGDLSVSGDCAEYQIHTQSGDAKLECRHDADINAHTTSGDLSVRILEAQAYYNMDTSTVSGDCSVTGSAGAAEGTAARRLTARSISGDINIRFS